jgi:hypothetical protein
MTAPLLWRTLCGPAFSPVAENIRIPAVVNEIGRKMNTIFTALIIPARTAQPVRVEPIEATLKNLQELVAGDIECITRGDWHVYLNAEGVIRNLPLNLRAAQLTYDRGLDLAGAARGCAVFLGNDEHRGETDVPEHLVRRAEELFGMPLAA